MDDRNNGLSWCVLRYIGRGSHNNRLLSSGLYKGEIAWTPSQFDVESIVFSEESAQLIRNDILTGKIVAYFKYESY